MQVTTSFTPRKRLRHMEGQFPNEGFVLCKDQCMLGGKYQVASIVKPHTARTVKLPKGNWRDDTGKLHKGGQTITIDVPSYFEKIKQAKTANNEWGSQRRQVLWCLIRC